MLCVFYHIFFKKVAINKLTCLCNHNVVVVPVAYSKNKGCHTVASTGINKSLHGCLKLIQMHLNVSCVLTTESSTNLSQMTFNKTSFWEPFSESKLVVCGSINIVPVKCQLSRCSTYILGKDSMILKSRRRKQEAKGNINVIKGVTSPPGVTCQQLHRTRDFFVIGEHELKCDRVTMHMCNRLIS